MHNNRAGRSVKQHCSVRVLQRKLKAKILRNSNIKQLTSGSKQECRQSAAEIKRECVDFVSQLSAHHFQQDKEVMSKLVDDVMHRFIRQSEDALQRTSQQTK